MAELEIKPTGAMKTRVTAVILVGTAISLVLIYLLVGGGTDLFARRARLITYRSDSAGLNTDSEVRLAGIQIGDVDKVELAGGRDPMRAVRVEMRVLARYLRQIPSDSQTDVNADTIVDYPFVEIDPGTSPLPIAEESTLPSKPAQQATDRAELIQTLQQETAQVDQIMIQVTSPDTRIGKFVTGETEYDTLLSRVDGFDTALRRFLTPRSSIGQAFFSLEMYTEVNDLATSADQMLVSIQNGQGTTGRLFASSEQYDQFVRQLTGLRNQLADANSGKGQFGSFLHDDAGYLRVARLLAATDSMLASLNAGEGRYGQLLANPQLYESLNGSLKSMETLLRDFHDNPQKYFRYKLF
jgi:ABC-type transporter Mla subunit MlaD